MQSGFSLNSVLGSDETHDISSKTNVIALIGQVPALVVSLQRFPTHDIIMLAPCCVGNEG